MTAAEQFWARVQRTAASMSPEMQAAMLRAFDLVREHLTAAEVARLVAAQDVDAVIRLALSDAILQQALAPVREQIRRTTARGFTYFARELPKPPGLTGTLTVGFDLLSPNTVAAVRALETRVMQTLADDIRETVRGYLQENLAAGANPRALGKTLRNVVGLAPNQEAAVQNFEAMLRAGDREALTRVLRDRRYDATLRKALGKNGSGLTESQIEKMVAAYRRKMVAYNANTLARTATLDAFKAGQRLAWEQAIANGAVDPNRLMKRWKGVMDNRERAAHVAMEGETVPFNSRYSNGEMIPGDSTYNCRCIPIYFVRAA